MRELLGDAGILAQTAEDVADALTRLKAEDGLRRDLGRAARRRVMPRTWSRATGAWRELLLDLLGQRLEGPVVAIASLALWGQTGGGQRPQKLAEAFARRGVSALHIQPWESGTGPLPQGVATLPYDEVVTGGLTGEPKRRSFRRFWQRVDELCAERPRLAVISACSPGMVALAQELKRQGIPVAYDVLDDWEAFGKLPGQRWYRRKQERELLELADRVTAGSPALVEKLGPDGIDLSPNAVEWSVVTKPKARTRPADMPRGRGVTVGYVGSLGGAWHDWAAVQHIAQARPEWKVVLIGPDGHRLPSSLTTRSNVHVLPPKPHSEVAAYIDHFDVGLIPFKQDALSDAVSPIKAYDYLARSCPVVSSPMSGLRGLPMVHVARTPRGWVRCIENALKRRRERPTHWLWQNTWDTRVRDLVVGDGLRLDMGGLPEVVRDRFRAALYHPNQTSLRVHWQMSGRCNYNCPYCCADWDFHRKGARWTLKEMQEAWERFNADHGACQIGVSGLEPTYGRKNLQMLAWLSRENVLDIDTNFSFPLSALDRFPHPENVFFPASYHPSSGVKPEAFIRKMLAVRERGFGVVCASLVCYPPYLKRLAKWHEQFEEAGVCFIPRPFYGTYRGRQFPEEYSDKERELLSHHLSPGAMEFQLKLRSTKGVLCAAGSKYLLVQADGTVHRCPHGAGDLGGLNFFHDHIPVRDHPTVCTFDRCWCEDLWGYHISPDERRDILGGEWDRT